MMKNIIETLSLKFKSGNSVPVTEARFKAEEWQQVLDYVKGLETSLKIERDINPLGVKFTSIPEFGDHMTLDEFKTNCKYSMFINSDGFGDLATETHRSNIEIRPSKVPNYQFPEWCTHIVWYNK